jgi:Family of unknown function (DUF6356)
MNLIRGFTQHPATVGESYAEHLLHAACFGTRMVLAGLACLIHAVFPFAFERTGSRAISELNERMVSRRRPARIAPEKRLLL